MKRHHQSQTEEFSKRQKLAKATRIYLDKSKRAKHEAKTFADLRGLDVESKHITTSQIDRRIAGTFSRCARVHGLFDAIHVAFTDEIGVALDPMHFWLAIIQAISSRLNRKGDEKLFHELLGINTSSADDKKTLEVRHDGLLQNSTIDAETPKWATVFPVFENLIQQEMKSEWSAQCVQNFTTSTPVTQIAQQLVLMDSVKNYFEYVVFTKCGIPFIDLLGTKQDWLTIKNTLIHFSQHTFQKLQDGFFHKWLLYTVQVIDMIIQSFDGTTEQIKQFYQNIYKYRQTSGGSIMDGWILLFFPYNNSGQPKIELAYKVLNHRYVQQLSKLEDLSSGMNTIDFKWKYMGKSFNMVMTSGFMEPDLRQDCIYPQIGWMVNYKQDTINHQLQEDEKHDNVDDIIDDDSEPDMPINNYNQADYEKWSRMTKKNAGRLAPIEDPKGLAK